MGKYEIVRELEALKLRIDQFEGRSPGQRGEFGHERSEHSGSIFAEPRAGIDPEMKPIHWKGGKGLPPFMFHLFGLPPNTQFNIAPESKTWTCTPEPLIVTVNWDTGGRDEHFRFADQVFSVIRTTDPNTGIATATAIYSARLIQRNGRSVDWVGGYMGPPYVPASYGGPSFHVTLRSAGGAGLFSYYDRFTVTCGASHMVNFTSNFPPGLYDLVTGANWEMSNWRVLRC
jgi:hypothetical protein